jgi:lysine 2,3-aminomutase
MIYNNSQKAIANKIEETPNLRNWKDWKWQLKHSIRSIEQFEFLTGIKFEEKEKQDLVKTIHNALLPLTHRQK